MSDFLCFGCTQQFVVETLHEGRDFKGVTFDAEPTPDGTACARCDTPLPESPELEAAARDLLMEVS